jgi:beta-ribofuranosylaminobenzene 5'-phosphate synthase
MIRVRTPSRLHFGLLDPSGHRGRRFGGVGLMIQRPGIRLTVEPAPRWSFSGPLAERAERLVHHCLLASRAGEQQPLAIHIEAAPPEHCGLGTGTQLAMGLARAVEELSRQNSPALEQLAERLQRGRRSAIGLYGFRLGGFLVDGGKLPNEPMAPLVARVDLPTEWRIVLIIPKDRQGLHGPEEMRAFERLPPGSEAQTGERCRLVLMELLPALERGDFDRFGENLYEFNRLAGEAFRVVQGNTYAHPQVAEIVAFVRSSGIRGVGQSSWGPTVFAFAPDEQAARGLADRVLRRFDLTPTEVVVTAADKRGGEAWRD